MATPTQQQQPYGGNPYSSPATNTGGGGAPAQQQQAPYQPESRPPQSAPAPYQPQQQPQQQQAAQTPFEKYCVIHIATTCDEHGVYVTKDSAEVIEIGWVVVDAQNPEREVRELLLSRRDSGRAWGDVQKKAFVERDTGNINRLDQLLIKISPTTVAPPVRARPSCQHSYHASVHLPHHSHLGTCKERWHVPRRHHRLRPIRPRASRSQRRRPQCCTDIRLCHSHPVGLACSAAS